MLCRADRIAPCPRQKPEASAYFHHNKHLLDRHLLFLMYRTKMASRYYVIAFVGKLLWSFASTRREYDWLFHASLSFL